MTGPSNRSMDKTKTGGQWASRSFYAGNGNYQLPTLSVVYLTPSKCPPLWDRFRFPYISRLTRHIILYPAHLVWNTVFTTTTIHTIVLTIMCALIPFLRIFISLPLTLAHVSTRFRRHRLTQFTLTLKLSLFLSCKASSLTGRMMLFPRFTLIA